MTWPPGQGDAPAPPAPGGTGRRHLVTAGLYVGLLATALVGGAIYAAFEGTPPQRLGPRRLLPPPLRTSLGGQDTLFLLTRRSEQDATDAPGQPAPRERVELHALALPELVTRFVAHLVTMESRRIDSRGSHDMRDGLIGEQGATIWLWLDGLGAVSAVDGQVLADQAGIAGRNAAVPGLASPVRGQVRLADALVFDPRGGPAWRIDPRDFVASPTTAPAPRPLPALSAAAAFGPGGPTAFRVLEARLGEAWFGLPPRDARLDPPVAARGPGTRFLSPTAPGAGTTQQLWRGAVRMGSAAPPGWPANFPDRFGQAERLVDVARLAGVAGLTLAGFLTAGGEAPILLADPPGVLVLEGMPGQGLTLLRVDAAGAVAWRAALPIARVTSVMPGARHLALAGLAPPPQETETLVVVALADGAVTLSGVAA
ncbi:hypothetical protein [Roseomonas sp. CECT 9278]|uniref:hypothetical protein n=1 Tax=Roseomonas sp. CECT 9278 TaxID=2845823 RepID=UPI001E35F83B|nr:hypothetical protein [Roseomonas sp. CECT 9278]